MRNIPLFLVWVYDYLKPHPGRQILSDGRATYLVKEPISFRSATLTCAGNIDLDFVTTQLFDSLQSTGVFEGLKLNDASTRYEIIPTVVGFTDFFDNVVHLKIKFVDRHANQILYDDTFMGSRFTKTASVRALAKAMPYVASKIRRALSQTSATTHQEELYSVQQVSVPQTEDTKHNARGFSLPDSTGTVQSNVTPPKFSVAEPGQRWAVVIGISAFQDSRIPSLRYASADAQAFYDWAVSHEGGKYAPARVKLLLDQQATCKQLKDALFVWLKQTLEKDMVTIYFASYGSPESPDSPNNLFFLSYDTRYDNIPSTSFPMWDIETALKRYVKAKKVVVIVDACHSGGIGQLFDIARRANRGLKVTPINTGIQNLSNIGDGVCVISASDEKQFSQESKDWGGWTWRIYLLSA